MTNNETTFLNDKQHIKTRINHLQKEMEDFKQIKRKKQKDEENLTTGENEDEGLNKGRRKWLNQQIEKNEEKIKELHQKLLSLKESENGGEK